MLFQVAVVLVRRALGRVEQREECEGQMETLERLRGVREQVQQEDDTFIGEVRHLASCTPVILELSYHACTIHMCYPTFTNSPSPFHPHPGVFCPPFG